ncbi:FAD-dependent oxidoreductase [Shimia sp. R11_0]|uniref:FAD-dependent oxidoreductase n=1 Tax=Shimia sp. R11_0 TaxID=2821096 RepID=UPI001ADB7CBF|nr:FAD-dependent oxidoreductase [Shimia sp. R11_0]MBO9476464.1 FAD-dependent oxidoreductase [Shimia sp. R11_0]
MENTSVDVLVVGGGTAGFGAALAAARKGLSVTLLEANSKIGGVMAFCPGMPWGGGYPCDHSIGGIFEELTNRLTAMSPPAAEKRASTLANFGPEVIYDHDIATLTMFEMLEEAGVDLRLNATHDQPTLHNNSITSVTYFDRNGRHTVTPKIVIDCSGDGDLSAKAGVPHTLGDTNGNMMGVTLSFFMEGADWDRVFAQQDPYFQDYAAVGIREERLHPDLAKLYLMKGFHPGSVFCNTVVIRGVDGTNAQSISRATQEGRRRCLQLSQFLRSDVPGFENAHMKMLGPTVGVRETRKLEGMVRVCGADLAQARKYEDGIVCCDNPIDDVMRDSDSMTHEAIVQPGQYYTLPFRALVPKTIRNLMFAGRIVSADDVAFASVRGMPQCMTMGQATGTAAALALKASVSVQKIATEDLVADLVRQGLHGLGGEPLIAPNT